MTKCDHGYPPADCGLCWKNDPIAARDVCGWADCTRPHTRAVRFARAVPPERHASLAVWRVCDDDFAFVTGFCGAIAA